MTTPRFEEWFYVLADTLCYVIAASNVAVAVAAVGATLAFEAFWSGFVLLLFLLGWLVFAYATVLGWPASRRPSRTPIGKVAEIGSGLSSGDRPEGLLERLVVRFLPDQWSLAPSNRLTPAIKLFMSSLAILTISLGIEWIIIV